MLPDGLDSGSLPDGPRLRDELPEPFCEPGEAAARAALDAWLDGPVDRLRRAPRRSRGRHERPLGVPALGLQSRREAEERAIARGGEGAAAFVRQLAWRDFYAHVLLLLPDNARLEFQERYRDLEWADDPELLEAWTRAAPATRSSTPGCASSPRPAGCTTARGWSSARS